MSHKSSGASFGEKKSQKVADLQPLYAIVDLSMGDSFESLPLCALVSVSPCFKFVNDLCVGLHRHHPEHHDFGVIRSTPLAYFGKKAELIAFNGCKLNK